jgi:hypothetical protein
MRVSMNRIFCISYPQKCGEIRGEFLHLYASQAEETYSLLAFAIYSVALKPRKFHKQYTG